MSTPTQSSIRTPNDTPHQSLSDPVSHWSAARLRTTLVAHVDGGTPTADDLFAELVYGTHIAQEATSGRWCVVADLLCTRNAPSWPEIGTAMAMTGLEAKTGFHERLVITSPTDLPDLWLRMREHALTSACGHEFVRRLDRGEAARSRRRSRPVLVRASAQIHQDRAVG